MNKKNYIKEQYNKTAKFYDKRYQKIQKEKYERMIDFEVKGRVLDLGCGTGLLKTFLKNIFTGIDISIEMLKVARKRMNVVLGDAENLPFKTNVFDFCFSFTCLQNLENPDMAILEVARVLKPEGIFVFTILKKKFSETLIQNLENSGFLILERRDCSEDWGFKAKLLKK